MRDLEADLKLCGAATEGPWTIAPCNAMPGFYLYGPKSSQQVKYEENPTPGLYKCFPPPALAYGDAEFIAAARTGWPETIRELMEARKRIEELELAIRQHLPEGCTPPERDTTVEIELCRRYIESCHNPWIIYGPQTRLEDLEAELKRKGTE